ncbi:hypothetical protein [Micromonospora sp. DT62]|uniref:hypothetical protein n=1 Tax=Micromonospora sp. DT62 TaxID=3416521 RepID=UPI003CF132BA
MRATAKWTIGALGAVGAALLGAVPLTALGKLEDAADVTATVTGLVLALVGIGWAIWKTTTSLVPPITTLATIDELPGLRAMAERSPEAFFGAFGRSAVELDSKRQLHETVAFNLAAATAAEPNEARRRLLSHHLAVAQGNVRLARSLQRQLLDLAHAWQVRQALRRAQAQTAVGVAVTLIGVAVLLSTSVEFPDAPAPKPSTSSGAP